jgi:acetolactate synthase small subunit
MSKPAALTDRNLQNIRRNIEGIKNALAVRDNTSESSDRREASAVEVVTHTKNMKEDLKALRGSPLFQIEVKKPLKLTSQQFHGLRRLQTSLRALKADTGNKALEDEVERDLKLCVAALRSTTVAECKVDESNVSPSDSVNNQNADLTDEPDTMEHVNSADNIDNVNDENVDKNVDERES